MAQAVGQQDVLHRVAVEPVRPADQQLGDGGVEVRQSQQHLDTHDGPEGLAVVGALPPSADRGGCRSSGEGGVGGVGRFPALSPPGVQRQAVAAGAEGQHCQEDGKQGFDVVDLVVGKGVGHLQPDGQRKHAHRQPAEQAHQRQQARGDANVLHRGQHPGLAVVFLADGQVDQGHEPLGLVEAVGLEKRGVKRQRVIKPQQVQADAEDPHRGDPRGPAQREEVSAQPAAGDLRAAQRRSDRAIHGRLRQRGTLRRPGSRTVPGRRGCRRPVSLRCASSPGLRAGRRRAPRQTAAADRRGPAPA